ncbi:MAG: virginiamycin lyase [Actinomycetota bacterium]
MDHDLQFVAPRRRRPLVAVAIALTTVAAIAVPTLHRDKPKTELSNRGTQNASPALDAEVPIPSDTIEAGDESVLAEHSTTTHVRVTTTTVIPIAHDPDPTLVLDADPEAPEPPRVVADQFITEFAVPTKKSWPYGITTGPDGAIWFVENGSAAGYGNVSGIARLTLDGHITEYPTPSAGPVWIAPGPDGALWFTKAGDQSIGRITTDGTISEYAAGLYSIWSITSGPDGALWMTQRATEAGGFVIRMTTAGEMTKFKMPHDFAVSLAFGPDGNAWVADGAGFIARLTPTGQITEFAVTWDPYVNYVGPIIAGPDGAMWFGASGSSGGGGWIGRITMDGELSRFPLPTDGDVASLVSGPDGYLWVTMNNSNVIVRVSTEGNTTAYSAYAPMGIAVGPDGAIWFTSTWGNSVSRLSIDLADTSP